MTKGKEEDENKAKRGMSPQKTKKRPYHRTRFRRLAFQASTSWQSRWLVLMPQGAQGVLLSCDASTASLAAALR
jgi:hypothetical protein